jgi:hypothetical protein
MALVELLFHDEEPGPDRCHRCMHRKKREGKLCRNCDEVVNLHCVVALQQNSAARLLLIWPYETAETALRRARREVKKYAPHALEPVVVELKG